MSLSSLIHGARHGLRCICLLLAFLCCLATGSLAAEPSATPPSSGGTSSAPGLSSAAGLLPVRVSIGNESGASGENLDMGIKVLFAITLLSLAPSIVMLMTSFVRIVIVLSFVRSALSLQATPSNQIIIGLSMFMTYFIMEPVWTQIDSKALKPYQAKQLTSDEAMTEAARPIRAFMLKQTRPRDVELFVSMARLAPTRPEELPLKVVVPSFIISELRTSFQMGFLIFIPFLLIDLVVATVLMSMGMMMMPPTTISLPLKILLFVLVDGWGLLVRSLVQSFNT